MWKIAAIGRSALPVMSRVLLNGERGGASGPWVPRR